MDGSVQTSILIHAHMVFLKSSVWLVLWDSSGALTDRLMLLWLMFGNTAGNHEDAHTSVLHHIPAHEHLCFLFPLSLEPVQVSFSSLGVGQTAAQVLDTSSEGAELSASTSALSETDRDVGNPLELPGPGAGVKPGTPNFFVCRSFSSTFPRACFLSHILPPYRCFPSLPFCSCFAPPFSCTFLHPPPLRLLRTLMSRLLRQCGLCLQAVRAGTLPTGTLNGTN